ncbi:MAG: hypothetical protein LCH32_10580 [Bacteroidetes bacterium]|nr:hypothetical protein [Bacteroidota bacterium]
MKKLITLFFLTATTFMLAQKPIKVKELKLKYTLPEGWNVSPFTAEINWENSKNTFCNCSAIHFYSPNKNGQFNVVVYPTLISGLDSTKRNFVGALNFVPVEKYDKTKNEFFSFEKRHSHFVDSKKGNQKSYDVVRFVAKLKDRAYVFYAWQESMNLLNPNVEKDLNKMINAIEPLD